MWQLFSLSAILCNSIEEVIDKATMLGASDLDTIVAAWIRNVIVFCIALVVAIVSHVSIPQLLISVPLMWWGFVYAIQAISYTWILKHIELTAASVSFALLPLAFLPIDLYVRHEQITRTQIFGVLFLVIGALVFFVRNDPSRKISLSKYLRMMSMIFVFDAIVFGSEGYIFKSLQDTTSIAPSAFLVSGMFYMCIVLTLFLAIQYIRRGGTLSLAGARAYAGGSSIAKIADYGNVFFTLQALTLATVSQVMAMKVVHPIILLIVTMIAQHKFNVELDEAFTRDTAFQKVLGIVLVVIGSFLIA